MFEYANPAFLDFFGVERVEGLPAHEAVPAGAKQGCLDLLDQIYRTAEPIFAEERSFRFARTPGEPAVEHFFDVVLQPVFGPAGDIVGIFGQCAESTARVRAEQSLRESEARLELATRAAELGIWDWNLQTGEIVFSPRAREIWGFPLDGPITEELMGATVHPEDLQQVHDTYHRAIDPEIREASPYEYRLVHGEGDFRWVRAHGEAVFEEREGKTVPLRYVGTMEDVTADRKREDALRSSQTRLRLAMDAGRMAAWALDDQGRLELTPEFNRVLKLPADAQPTLDELQAFYYPGEYERVEELVSAALARKERYLEFEYRHLWPEGEPRWLLVRAELLTNDAGEFAGATGVVLDITERRESEERLRLLAREVDHRANNLLTVVQGAIALSQADSAAELKEALLGRVSALAKAHQLLSSSRWVGADLRRLVEDEIQPYCEERPECAEIQGASVPLTPAVAQGLAMALHELATNAVKYGAWSSKSGSVKISWTGGVRGKPLVLTWTESGGPPVHKPTQSRLGMQVITRSVAGALGGRAELDWRPEGLICRITVEPSRQAGTIATQAA